MAKVRVTWNDIEALRASREGVKGGLAAAAAAILEASNQMVPYETGHLMSTGRVDFDLEVETAHVYYDTVYAARLHQNPSFNFQNGRRARYLQTAAYQGRSKVIDAFETQMKFKFAKGGHVPGGGGF